MRYETIRIGSIHVHVRQQLSRIMSKGGRLITRTTARTTTTTINRRSYHDKVLQWAKDHPQIAQSFLQPPPWWNITNCNPNYSDMKESSLEGYCQWRTWPQSSSSSQHHQQAMALTSHVLSAPLTLARFYSLYLSVYPFQTSEYSSTKSSHISSPKWCCVGARAEATLPYDYWKEFLLLSSAMVERPINISMDFVGPDIASNTPDRTISLEDGSTISLSWPFSGLLHEMNNDDNKHGDNTWDAYIFFNPGFGHPNLKEGWEPTLERILTREDNVLSSSPLLLTAHSAKDAARDAECLARFGLENVQYQVNPFASRITYQDPFDDGHIVRPNHYYAIVINPSTV